MSSAKYIPVNPKGRGELVTEWKGTMICTKCLCAVRIHRYYDTDKGVPKHNCEPFTTNAQGKKVLFNGMLAEAEPLIIDPMG